MPERLPFDDFFCKLLGLGDPKKWNQIYHQPQFHQPSGFNTNKQPVFPEMVHNQGYYGVNQGLVPENNYRRAEAHHRKQAVYHLQCLGIDPHVLRQLGLDGRHQQSNVLLWSPSEVKKFFNVNDHDLIEFLGRIQRSSGRPCKLSDFVDIENQRRVIALYLRDLSQRRQRLGYHYQDRDGGHRPQAFRQHYAPRPGRPFLNGSDVSSNDEFLERMHDSSSQEDQYPRPHYRRRRQDFDYGFEPGNRYPKRGSLRDDSDDEPIYTY